MKPPGGNVYDRYVNDNYIIFQWACLWVQGNTIVPFSGNYPASTRTNVTSIQSDLRMQTDGIPSASNAPFQLTASFWKVFKIS